jgi:regulatory protein
LTADLFTEDESNPGQLESNQPKPSDIRAFALRLVSNREYAVLEMQDRLLRKWPASTDETRLAIEELVSVLQSTDLLSDERFAEAFVRSRCIRFQGPFKIHADLRVRKVPEHIIQSVLNEQEENWVTLAVSWLQKHCKETLDYQAKAKYYRRLTSRGFNHEQAMRALEIHRESEDFDSN